ncbi:MAG: DNA polymerase III subunit beta [Desulfurellales bacterium]|nr:MAG: DNA polymerase III subunit beta [Desulfurellales bacterium]
MLVRFVLSEFRRAFTAAAKAAAKKGMKDILRKVHVRVSPGAAVFTGSDGEIHVTSTVVGVGTDGHGGAFLLPAERVGAILQTLDTEEIAIRVDGTSVQVSTDGAKFKLATESPDEFPTEYDVDNVCEFEISAKELLEAIRRTSFCCDVDSTRYALGGVLFVVEHGSLVLVSTDTRRLSKVVAGQVSGMSGEMPSRSVVVQKRALEMLSGVFTESDTVRLLVGNNRVSFESGAATVACMQVEGRFPKYKDVMPSKYGTQIEIPIDPFHSAIRSILTIASAESRSVRLKFWENELQFFEEVTDIGSAEVKMPIAYDGVRIEITVDAKYIGEFFPRVRAHETFVLCFTDAQSCIELRNETETFRYIVMPLSGE